MATFSEMMKAARSRHQDGDPKREGKRFREILSILRKHDLKDGVSPEAAVELLQDLGPTFVKLGQIASTHPDVLPMEYCKALGSLRSNASPLGMNQVHRCCFITAEPSRSTTLPRPRPSSAEVLQSGYLNNAFLI